MIRCTSGHWHRAETDCLLDHGSHGDGCPKLKPAVVGLVCTSHARQLEETLRELARHWIDLAFIIEAGSAPPDDSGRSGVRARGVYSPAPVNLSVLALQDPRSAPTKDLPSVPAVVARWVRTFVADRCPTMWGRYDQAPWNCDTIDWSPWRPRRLPSSTVGQLNLLEANVEWACTQSWLPTFGSEMFTLLTAVKHTLRDKATPELGRCLHCDTGVVEWKKGVRCPSCGARWKTPQEMARLKVGQAS